MPERQPSLPKKTQISAFANNTKRNIAILRGYSKTWRGCPHSHQKWRCLSPFLPLCFAFCNNPENLEEFFKKLDPVFRFAVEFGHLSWMREETWQLLNKHKVAYASVDEPLLPPGVHMTADFAYFGGMEEEVLRALLNAFSPNNELIISIAIFGIALISTIASILGTLTTGGKMGLLIVAIAWIAGFLMPIGGPSSVIGAFLLIAAVILGPVVADLHAD